MDFNPSPVAQPNINHCKAWIQGFKGSAAQLNRTSVARAVGGCDTINAVHNPAATPHDQITGQLRHGWHQPDPTFVAGLV
jgi:hypothetical protein